VFDHLATDSTLFRKAREMPAFVLRDHVPSVQMHWLMQLPDSVEGLYASLSYNQRQHFRKTARKLRRNFPEAVKVSRLRLPADLDGMIPDIEEIAKKTYQRRLGVGFNTHPSLIDYLRMEAERGWLRIHILYLNDKPCAFWIGAVYQQTFHSDYTGFDPEFTQHAPGTCLLTEILEELSTTGVNCVDFGFGDNAYKERISSVGKHEATVHLFAPSPKGIGLCVMRGLTSFLHEPARAFLKRTNLTQKVKRAWRALAGSGKGEPER
jgi:CelD/BcsL family acetyltransferase involved in cellulose biosynthesis